MRVLLKWQSIKITTTKSCFKLYHVECEKFCKLIITKNLLDKVNYSFKTICQQTTTKTFMNSSILPMQLIKKGTFSWICQLIYNLPMYLYILEGQNFLISISTNDLPTVTNALYLLQGVSQKIETTDVFSESGN